MGKSKKFINRKNAVTFHLVHRSQRDPLVTDETAPQHVLVEAPKPLDKEKLRAEQHKFGIFYDDDYDYLQHLKNRGNVVWEYVETPNQKKDKKPGIQLPSSVFASEFEEDEGMLNKAAPHPGPRPDLDPDVIAALDEDFDFNNPDNELEDDFITKAMGGDDDQFDENEDEYIDSDGPMYSDDEDEGELMDRLAPLLRNRRFSNEETKSRFTEYSMSSSVIRRNEQLSLLDDRFDKFYASYDEPEIGPLDMEEIEGYVGDKHAVLMNCYSEFKRAKQIEKYDKNWDKDRVKRIQNEGESSEEEIIEMEVEDENQKKKWDCESILSTYSNIYNHPKLIEEPRRKIQIDPRTGMPIDVLRGSDTDKLTTKTLAKFDTENRPAEGAGSGPKSLCAKSVLSTLSVLSIRPKDETLDEKRERKRLLKEYRSERRVERKANAEAFKEEKKRQEKIKINKANNMQGKRIL